MKNENLEEIIIKSITSQEHTLWFLDIKEGK